MMTNNMIFKNHKGIRLNFYHIYTIIIIIIFQNYYFYMSIFKCLELYKVLQK